MFLATFKHLSLHDKCVCVHAHVHIFGACVQSAGSIFYLMAIIYHLPPLLHHACGRSCEWSVKIKEPRTSGK